MEAFFSKVSLLTKELTKKESKSIISIFLDLLNFTTRLGMSPGEYFAYRLHLKNPETLDVFEYLPSSSHFGVHLKTLNKEGREFLFDKLLFKELMIKSNIKVPATIGYAGRSKREEVSFSKIEKESLNLLLQEQNIKDFIIKPANGTQGQGVFIVNYDTESLYPFKIDDLSLDKNDFFKFITNHSTDLRHNYIIFEELIEIPKLLYGISPTANPNVRIITLRTPDGKVHITGATAGLGRSGSATSNVGSGGFIAKVDIETGRITHCKTNSHFSGSYFLDNPDTNEKIVGFGFPYWSEIISTCIHAAESLKNINSVGWDFLITEDGPVILEANDDWDVISQQVFGTGYLSQGTRKLLSKHGLEFPENALPPPTLKSMKESLFGLEKSKIFKL